MTLNSDAKFEKKLSLMTVESHANFEEKLTYCLKNDMRNLMNCNSSSGKCEL